MAEPTVSNPAHQGVLEATEETRLFRLDGDTFSQLMEGSLDIVRGVLHVLCDRLRRTSASSGRV